ncbi:homocitrate synthase [Drepanopeziza brunnea f. sp. 'multigermtubi' MB_m1]|uniref:Homocitrate synthase n=1 Tax=Marssonina brunnea f. sp. multigermtubi (strain MB_m1) TaxID=1072389 RepID=K1W9Y1_MARBU|nr:homocitrate synthase [Drepanopeziza brunnea f. sp. 'multigermtubi' MB_m1]EKD14065.1 homocitrate synthase [Drepanopeziza brunnea f. sp. 'multigermtubi' MB_m1]
MPLHLLGKKSWNVYNTANIEKVKRDEAAAAALEAAEEERMQAVDAARRMAILRGEVPTPLAIADGPSPSDPHQHPGKRDGERGGAGRERRKRKRAGEDDTGFEMRVALEEREALAAVGKQLVLRKETEAPLVDPRGHIDLFPRPKAAPTRAAEKNAEAEQETARKRKEYEDQYTMRFSNAAGLKQGLENPWYSKTGRGGIEEEAVGKDVWGNADPRRKERESQRIVDNDPLAMMKAGARQAREVKKEREKWREEREREVRELEDAERRKRSKRRYEDSEDELEGFRLDRREERSSKRHARRDRQGERERERRHRHREAGRGSHRERRDSTRSPHRNREEGSGKHRHRSRHHD